MENISSSSSPVNRPRITRNLPLERCREEIEYVSSRWAFRAPEGWAFRVEGSFDVETQNSSGDMLCPSESRQLYLSNESNRRKYEAFRRQYEEDLKQRLFDEYLWSGAYDKDFEWNKFDEWYEGYLKEHPPSDEQIWNELQGEEEREFPECFVGKWLHEGVDEWGDAYVTVLAMPVADVRADYGTARFEELMRVSPQQDFMRDGMVAFSSYIRDKWFETEWKQIMWWQNYVRIAVGATATRLTFVPYDVGGEIEIPDVPDLLPELLLPIQEGSMTSTDYIENVMGRKLYSDDFRMEVIRARRQMGPEFMFKDDPFLNFNQDPEREFVESLGLGYKLILPSAHNNKRQDTEIIPSASKWREDQIRRAYYNSLNYDLEF